MSFRCHEILSVFRKKKNCCFLKSYGEIVITVRIFKKNATIIRVQHLCTICFGHVYGLRKFCIFIMDDDYGSLSCIMIMDDDHGSLSCIIIDHYHGPSSCIVIMDHHHLYKYIIGRGIIITIIIEFLVAEACVKIYFLTILCLCSQGRRKGDPTI